MKSVFNAKYDLLLLSLILAFHFFLGITSSFRDSQTFDELFYITGGYAAWKYNDYRINPENGNFPQRWAAVPLLFDKKIKFPDMGVFSADNHQVKTGLEFLYGCGNQIERILLEARAMMLLMSVILGLTVFFCSRRIFGRTGGFVSLLLYAFSPVVLADARLATSDLAVAFGFTISIWALWELLSKVSVLNIIFSTVSVFIVLTAKMSGVLIVPLFAVMFIARLFAKKDLPLALPGFRLNISGRKNIFFCLTASLLPLALGVFILMWAAFGFKYSMLHDEAAGRAYVNEHWEKMQKGGRGIVYEGIAFAKKHELLPEAYLFGFLHIYYYSQYRVSFINGKYSDNGFWYFFPYCMAVKNPLPFLFLLVSVAVVFLIGFLKGRGAIFYDYCYRLFPFAVFIFLYMFLAMGSKFNLGHRYILPIYPSLFIICGFGGHLFKASSGKIKILFLLLLSWYIGENLKIWPHYLAYFNQLIGGPRHAYRHLADSSLDWGQGLCGLRDWLAKNRKISDMNVYLSYFGSADIDSYKLGVKKLPSFLEQPQTEFLDYDFENGIFCISATMLQMLPFPGLADWGAKQEAAFREISSEIKTLLAARKNPDEFRKLVSVKGTAYWTEQGRLYELLRFAKLCAVLRKLGPDDNIGYSILIYRASSFRHLIKPEEFK